MLRQKQETGMDCLLDSTIRVSDAIYGLTHSKTKHGYLERDISDGHRNLQHVVLSEARFISAVLRGSQKIYDMQELQREGISNGVLVLTK